MKWQTIRHLKGLCFDIENMPGTYGPADYTHPKVTAIGWGWLDKGHPLTPQTQGRVLKRDDREQMHEVAEEFRGVWDEADFVVGHNIRRHDIKIIDGFYTSLDLPLLTRKRTVDTYLNQPKMQGFSRSLENLAARWNCPIKKLHLEEHVWEAAYDGIPWAVDIMRRRVQTDVAINVWLHGELIERGLLLGAL